MKWKLDRRSYLLGILIGAMAGIGAGYMIALTQGIHRIGSDEDVEVALGIATLRKLEKNDVSSASRLLRHVIASKYLEHSRMADSRWSLVSNLNPTLINRVEAAANELPGLRQAIEEERTKSATSKAEQDIAPSDR